MYFAFREISRGYQNILNFCKLTNMPPPLDKKSYRKTFTKLYRSYSNVAYQSISKAAEDISSTPEADGIKNSAASFDGTWQRRGYIEYWCKYQKQKVAGEITCKPKINIPEAVRDLIKPIFPTKISLLMIC